MSPIFAIVGAAMMSLGSAAAAPTPSPAAPTALTYSAAPNVSLVNGSARTAVPAITGQEFVVGQSRGIFFIPKNVTTRMAIFLPDPPALAASPMQTFDVNIAGVPWADPAHIIPVIVRLQSMNGHEHVIGSQATSTAVFTDVSTIQPLADDRVPAKVDLITRRHFRITPLQPLEPGEYGVALRDPDVKPWSGKMGDPSNGTMPIQQTYQMYAWPFLVGSGKQP